MDVILDRGSTPLTSIQQKELDKSSFCFFIGRVSYWNSTETRYITL